MTPDAEDIVGKATKYLWLHTGCGTEDPCDCGNCQVAAALLRAVEALAWYADEKTYASPEVANHRARRARECLQSLGALGPGGADAPGASLGVTNVPK